MHQIQEANEDKSKHHWAAAQALADHLKDMPWLLGVDVDTVIEEEGIALIVHCRPGTGGYGPFKDTNRPPSEFQGYKVYHQCLATPRG